MKQKKWFKGGVSSFLMGVIFFASFGMFACKGPNDSGSTEVEKVKITFDVEGVKKGTITAKIKGKKSIVTGAEIEKTETVVFTAVPSSSEYKVKGWKKDGKMVDGQTGNTYELSLAKVDKKVDVKVEFMSIPKPTFTVNYGLKSGQEGKATITAKEGLNTVSNGGKVEKGKTVTFTASNFTEGYTVKEWKNDGVKIGTGNTATVTVNGPVNVVLELNEPAPKKEAEITYVSINGVAWDAAKKMITLTDILGEPIANVGVILKARSVDGTVAEDSVETLEVSPKTAGVDTLEPDPGKTTTLVIKSKETDKLTSATVEVQVHVWKAIKANSVKFEPATTVTSTDATNKEQEVVITAKYPDNFEPLATKFIGSYIERTDKKAFPEGAIIKLNYKLGANPGVDSNEYTVPANKKIIYGCEIFPGITGDKLAHTVLNANHVGATEVFTITIKLPETATEDVEVVNVSGLFEAADAKKEEKILGETRFTIKGVVAKKEIEKVTFSELNVTPKDATNKEQTVVFTVKHDDDFEVPSPEKYIDAIITRTDGEDFPVGVEFAIKCDATLKGGITQSFGPKSYKVTATGVKKIFANQAFTTGNVVGHVSLNAGHVGITEKYTVTVKLPDTQTADVEIKNTSALFKNVIDTEPEKELGHVTFTLKGVVAKKEIEKVEMTKGDVTSEDETNKKQTLKITVQHEKFDLPATTKYIDSIITRTDGRDFPVGAKLTVKYEGTPKGKTAPTMVTNGEYTVQHATGKTIYGSQLFGTHEINHTPLNANHVELKEEFTITIELPETEENDVEIKNVSALFDSDKSTVSTKELANVKFTLKGVKKALGSVNFGAVTGKLNTVDSGKADVREATFAVTYPENFGIPTGASKKWVDAILTLEGNANFPKDAKIELVYKIKPKNATEIALPKVTYTVGENVNKIFGSKLFGASNPRSELNPQHVGAVETYEFTITLPATATDDTYKINVESALFDSIDGDAKTKTLGNTSITVAGYGK